MPTFRIKTMQSLCRKDVFSAIEKKYDDIFNIIVIFQIRIDSAPAIIEMLLTRHFVGHRVIGIKRLVLFSVVVDSVRTSLIMMKKRHADICPLSLDL